MLPSRKFILCVICVLLVCSNGEHLSVAIDRSTVNIFWRNRFSWAWMLVKISQQSLYLFHFRNITVLEPEIANSGGKASVFFARRIASEHKLPTETRYTLRLFLRPRNYRTKKERRMNRQTSLNFLRQIKNFSENLWKFVFQFFGEFYSKLI